MALCRRSTVLSYSLSGLLHAGLVIGLLLWGMPARRDVTTAPIDTVVRPSTPSRPETLPLPELPAHDSDSDADRPTLEGKDALAQVDSTANGLAEFTRQQLQRARERIADRPSAQQTDELEALARRLGNVSSEQSVEQLTTTLAPWLGIEGTRATEPAAEEIGAPFDPDTAQVSDVLKHEDNGTVQYFAVLVDAAGRSLETPLDKADGEALYDVFQLMKKFPLLETVYRKTVMGLLDQIIDDQPEPAASPQPDGETDSEQEQQQDGGPAPGA
jgi:molybdopterin converting factor small subunit